MHVKKKFHSKGLRSEQELLVSKGIDAACKKMRTAWPWTNMEFSIGKEMADRIYIPLNDFSVKSKDHKAIVAFVIQQMYLYYIRKNGFTVNNRKISPLIEKIISNRAMVKHGFADDLSYYYYIFLANRNKYVRTMDDFLEVSSAWLSFFGVDDYNTGLFRDMIRQLFKVETPIGKQGAEFLAYLKTNLKDNVYKHSDEMVKKYYDITKR